MIPARHPPAPHVPIAYLIVVYLIFYCCWLPLDEVGPPKTIRRVRLFTQRGRENGDLAIPHPLLVVGAIPSVADRCIQAGSGRLEEEEVFNLTNSARMGENSPIPTIIV